MIATAPLRPREIRAANPFSVACGAITRFDAKINAEYFFIPGCAPDVGKDKIPLTVQTAFPILPMQKEGGFYSFHRFRKR